jgi:hypothetical protein
MMNGLLIRRDLFGMNVEYTESPPFGGIVCHSLNWHKADESGYKELVPLSFLYPSVKPTKGMYNK